MEVIKLMYHIMTRDSIGPRHWRSYEYREVLEFL